MTKTILIDRTPPIITGNTKEDVSKMDEYLRYVQEQTNYILNQLYKRVEALEHG